MPEEVLKSWNIIPGNLESHVHAYSYLVQGCMNAQERPENALRSAVTVADLDCLLKKDMMAKAEF